MDAAAPGSVERGVGRDSGPRDPGVVFLKHAIASFAQVATAVDALAEVAAAQRALLERQAAALERIAARLDTILASEVALPGPAEPTERAEAAEEDARAVGGGEAVGDDAVEADAQEILRRMEAGLPLGD